MKIPHVELRTIEGRTTVLHSDPRECSPEGLSENTASLVPTLREILGGREQESFLVVMLDARGVATAWREVARGMADNVQVPVRELFRTALMCDARAVVIAHNHPSGNPSPSIADQLMTQRLAEAGNLVGCPIADHVVVGDGERWFSFRDGHHPVPSDGINVKYGYVGARQGPELD